jgi:hypothetical protein
MIAAAVLDLRYGVLLALLGFFTTGIYLFGTWQAIRMLAKLVAADSKPVPALTSFFIVLGFKVPFFLLLGLWLREADLRIQSCFLIGLVLVYSWVVAWALSRGNAADPNNGHS